MEGSTQLRLRAFLDETGTRHSWLIERLGVSKGHFSEWLSGKRPVPEHHRLEIIVVLRERQLKRIPTDLFDLEG